jgi:hypothetical protein
MHGIRRITYTKALMRCQIGDREMEVHYVTKFVFRQSDDDFHDRLIKSGKMCHRTYGDLPGTTEVGLRSSTVEAAISLAKTYNKDRPESDHWMTTIEVMGWSSFESHNATPTQTKTALEAEKCNETDG